MPLFYRGNVYTRRQISLRLGGGMQEAMPTKAGVVVAACLRRDPAHNPDAPDVILAGDTPRVSRAGELLSAQTDPVPVFVFNSPHRWEYRGDYSVKAAYTSGPEFDKWVSHGTRPASSISRVIVLRRAPGA